MVSRSILCNQQNIKAGRALLEGIAHGAGSEMQGKNLVRADTADEGSASQGGISAGVGNHGNSLQHSDPAYSAHASDCKRIVTPEQFHAKCEKVAEIIGLCSESCFGDIRQNYLAGALAYNELTRHQQISEVRLKPRSVVNQENNLTLV
jgi:hypothetical protein